MHTKVARVLKAAIVVLVIAFSSPAKAVPGDMDLDGDVDLADYAVFRDCLMGPGHNSTGGACIAAQFDNDGDVDLRETAGFQSSFTGGGACGSTLAHDCCSTPIVVSDSTRAYTNVGATTDGPDEPVACNFFGRTQVESDIWYCYTASCTGTAMVSLCGSDYDTKLAVYAGCGCPTTAPLACSDDNCGAGVENVQSRVEISATQGQTYMVRVGGFLGEQGLGQLTIGCNVDACANGSGDCFVPSPTHAPGCGDAACCADTCALDQFCCDVEWDAGCAGEAQGVCTGSFPACAPQTGDCGVPDNTPGCESANCCNRVCMVDPFCCLTAWDTTCVDEAESMCFLTCGRGAGDCFTPSPTGAPGCNNEVCCVAVCTEDPFCCATEWDQACVDLAGEVCP